MICCPCYHASDPTQICLFAHGLDQFFASSFSSSLITYLFFEYHYASTNSVYLYVLQGKHSNDLLVSPATRTRHKRQEQEVLQWLSIQSTTISSNQGNFSMMARQD